MDWLKEIIGEDVFKELEKSTFYSKFKDKLKGKYLYDSKKHMPKEQYNKKNEEAKDYKKRLEDMEELNKKHQKDYENMVTSKEHKEEIQKLIEKHNKEKDDQQSLFNADIEKKEKEYQYKFNLNLAKDMLKSNGVSDKNSKLLLSQINLDELVIKDDEILNQDKILLPLKTDYKDMFGNNDIVGQSPTKGNKNLDINVFEQQILEAQKKGDEMGALSLQMQYDEAKKQQQK
jgi:hypothetical protein